MSRRIDIELTSDRGDGTWTWRAAGAKQPKGTVAATLLPDAATVGQQLRADIDTTLDGTDVLAVLPPKAKNRSAAETIELLPRGGDEPLVTQTLAPGRKRGRDRERGERGDRERTRGRDGGRGRDGDRRPGGDRSRGGDRPQGGGERGPRGDKRDRGPGQERGPRGDRPDRPRRERPAPPPKPKAKRLRPGRAHRKAALDVLGPEEQVIGEQLLTGGIPGLRQAIEKQNAQAKAEGTRAVSAAPLLVIAERLWPALRSADWRDRAEAALADIDELDLRDLRSVVVAADGGAKDDESRELATQLRDGLTRRLDAEHHAWLDELSSTLQEGRVVRALRLSSRPPKAGAPLPPDLAAKLAEATTAALTADTLVDRWATVLDALSFSPVRLTVVPASKPDEPSAELLAVVTRMASRVPKVAEAFGIDPGAAPSGRGRGGRGGRGPKGAPAGGGQGTGRRPPKPKGVGGALPVPPPPPKPTAVGAPAAVAENPAPQADADTPAPTDAAEPTQPAEALPEAPTPSDGIAAETPPSEPALESTAQAAEPPAPAAAEPAEPTSGSEEPAPADDASPDSADEPVESSGGDAGTTEAGVGEPAADGAPTLTEGEAST